MQPGRRATWLADLARRELANSPFGPLRFARIAATLVPPCCSTPCSSPVASFRLPRCSSRSSPRPGSAAARPRRLARRRRRGRPAATHRSRPVWPPPRGASGRPRRRAGSRSPRARDGARLDRLPERPRRGECRSPRSRSRRSSLVRSGSICWKKNKSGRLRDTGGLREVPLHSPDARGAVAQLVRALHS